MNILIPTDFSDNSIAAIRYAIKLLTFKRPVITLLHVYKLKHYGAVITVDMDDMLKANCEARMQALIASLEIEFPDIEIKTKVEQGYLLRSVDLLLQTNLYDLLVMGTKGQSDMADMIFGSNAVQMIKHTRVPKLIIPLKAEINSPDNILFTNDENNLSDIAPYALLNEICKNFDSKLHILNLCHSKEACSVQLEKDKMNNIFALIPHEYHYRMQNDIAEGIISFAENEEVDLICLVQKHYSFFEGLFHKSVTREMSLASNTPLFILHE